ncbi:MAG TPA: hypothetical protein VIL00_01495 [Pseudonocardiaceae bacterium]
MTNAESPQDTGARGPVEQDAAALGAAEDLDEDRLRVDPLEAGMDPPERWMAVDRYGTTHYEQSHGRSLTERLAEEEPDAPLESDPNVGSTQESEAEEGLSGTDEPDNDTAEYPPEEFPWDTEIRAEAIRRGQLADEGGGSVAGAERTPPPSD